MQTGVDLSQVGAGSAPPAFGSVSPFGRKRGGERSPWRTIAGEMGPRAQQESARHPVGRAFLRRKLPVAANLSACRAFLLEVGASDEAHQFFVPGRTSDWHDLLADAAGAAAGVALIWVIALAARRRKSTI